MEVSERKIQVRSLAGESTTISISPNSTIEELKLMLKDSFAPAKNSPNFHLFFKGAKMSLGSRINSYSVGQSEFVVLVPFNKKDRRQTQYILPQQGTEPPKVPSQSTTSPFADLAWSDMMRDLSSLSKNPPSEIQPDLTPYGRNAQGSDTLFGESSDARTSKAKRMRVLDGDQRERLPDGLLKNILCSTNTNVLDEHGCGRFLQVLESVDCLSDPQSGSCLLFREVGFAEKDKKKLCHCPSWLKIILKAFAFLNIFSGFLQMQQKFTTWDCLQEALEQMRRYGLDVGISDMEHVSVLCPKVVRLGIQATGAAQMDDAIVIVRSSAELADQPDHPKAAKQVSISAIMNKIKKREGVFKRNLRAAVNSLVGKSMSRNMVNQLFSLEDLLISIKDSGYVSKGSEAKNTRRCCSITSSSQSVQTRCYETSVLLPVEMVEHLRKGIGSQGQIVHVEEIGARMAVHVEIPESLSGNTRSLLKQVGISRLYCHQAESIQASLSGKNVVVATMTSSGKSLCYNLPVLEALSQNLCSCAIYLFPTKALAQDQLRALLAMTERSNFSINIGVYDGDTSQEDRMWLRDSARLLITNPDMLHMSILPFHGQFQRILSNLRFVIIDEAHAYKGAFGCHTALILRRLRRLCCHVYGSDPSFVFSTATSANPREHAMELASLPTLELIHNDGSPCGPKLFTLWNPPLHFKTVSKTQDRMNENKPADSEIIARRSSPILELSCLFAEMVQHGLRCIAFCKTRKLTEIVLCYTREILQETAPHLVDSICAYRAGYIAQQDRRRIESEFFNGKLCGVAATNALELGIDVGHIDVTLHLGFPGSVASLWQQAGRSGRRGKESLAVYVAFEGPLDQYFMKFPQRLFGSPIESCHVDAHNQQVLEQHLLCAALEHPLSLLYDEKYFGSGLHGAIMALTEKGFLSCDLSRDLPAKIWSYIGQEKKPSHAISIRAIETERYKVIDSKRNEILEEIEESKAFYQVYEGAVYMHQGQTYLVKVLDLSAKIALCHEADLKYYTKTRDYTDIHFIGGDIAYPVGIFDTQHPRTIAQARTCKVTTTWFGFYRIWRASNQIFDAVELSLPKFSYESQAVWIRVPQSIKTEVEIQNFSFRAGLHAASHAILNVVPLYIMCNSSDLASECANPHETRYFPERILLYDEHPGGIGISLKLQPLFGELLTAALELLTTCQCLGAAGCPNCVQSLSCHEYNEVLDKNAAIMILQAVVEAENLNSGRPS
ncbi:PREDICTED: uncharacterized protein LOC104599902 isoform X3 [Nelumbo nucifera]|uniref:Uncharacterized protein LOC104599902 isoform X3 n=1 Tax=Nelumbo nucifera TaxID=4432 RepID=A0A1U8Q7C3_NELNU|nr:PREDICTED: uncharacterized protein LOC104599902 isoform X3 [Nelumbo nucifera]